VRTIVEVAGTVPDAPDAVFARLERKLTAPTECPVKREVDRERRFLAAQGGWWYRGEYEVSDAPDGARVVHRVRNAAVGQWWAVLRANRCFVGGRGKTEHGFRRLLAELGDGRVG
jgi:hypothetical protein